MRISMKLNKSDSMCNTCVIETWGKNPLGIALGSGAVGNMVAGVIGASDYRQKAKKRKSYYKSNWNHTYFMYSEFI